MHVLFILLPSKVNQKLTLAVVLFSSDRKCCYDFVTEIALCERKETENVNLGQNECNSQGFCAVVVSFWSVFVNRCFIVPVHILWIPYSLVFSFSYCSFMCV